EAAVAGVRENEATSLDMAAALLKMVIGQNQSDLSDNISAAATATATATTTRTGTEGRRRPAPNPGRGQSNQGRGQFRRASGTGRSAKRNPARPH
ncbi:MAG TPA: hypothetical protein DCL69_03295, partial [Firmicutes bacterium]|nr:hypothetical protein [Bacillota bacterium]